MNRRMWIVLLVAAGVFAGVWYAAGREETAAEHMIAPSASVSASSNPVDSAATGNSRSAAVAATASDVARWTAEANDANADTRAAAIRALANAPRAEALPVLHNVLINGEPQIDRPLALNSLRELALNQGDRDGKVREAIREAIYHSDDQNPTLMADAQDALDVVEESELR